MNIGKNNKKYLRIGAVALTATLAACTAAAFAQTGSSSDSYTVYADEGYYSETTYYLTEEDYNEHLASSGKTTSAASTYSANPVDGEEEFVMGISKTVWVQETADEEGNVEESKLLTISEMDALGIDPDSPTPLIFDNNFSVVGVIGGGGGSSSSSETTIGTEEYSYGELTIELKVTQNTTTQIYTATANAGWETGFTWVGEGETEAESFSEDYFALTWGGEKTLEAQSHSVSGQYYNDNEVEFRQSESDSYVGYTWYFDEQEWVWGKEMETSTATVTLKKIGDPVGLNTNVKFTYVHTYSSAEISVGIGISTKGLAPSLTISGSTKCWSLEIDVPGLAY